MSRPPVARWTGSVIAHERGGFVAVSDYMELERENAELRSALAARERDALDAKRYRVKIELLRDTYAPGVWALSLVDKNGGYRMAGGKASGQWTIVHTFIADFTQERLDRAHDALTPSTGGS